MRTESTVTVVKLALVVVKIRFETAMKSVNFAWYVVEISC